MFSKGFKHSLASLRCEWNSFSRVFDDYVRSWTKSFFLVTRSESLSFWLTKFSSERKFLFRDHLLTYIERFRFSVLVSEEKKHFVHAGVIVSLLRRGTQKQKKNILWSSTESNYIIKRSQLSLKSIIRFWCAHKLTQCKNNSLFG